VKGTYAERKKKLFNKLHIKQCAICGYKQTHLLDMHHILPHEKTEKVTTYVLHNKMKLAEEECYKCIALCAKHHREADSGSWHPSFLYHIAHIGEYWE